MHKSRTHTHSRRRFARQAGLNLVATTALVVAVSATAGAAATSEPTDPIDSAAPNTANPDAADFCAAEVAVETAVASEDPAAIGPALEALSSAAPDEVQAAVDTAVAEAEVFLAADGMPTEAFETAYADMLAYVAENCGFAELATTGTDYAFGGIPETVDAGPTLVHFLNDGVEFHEIALFRINDDVTETIEELLALAEDEVSAKITPIGGTFAGPGDETMTVVDLQPGRHVALCFLPEGATPENMPAIQSGEHNGAPHFMLGMVQEFEVV